MILVGQMDDRGYTLLYDKWANEVNHRVQAWMLPNGDVQLVFRVEGEPASMGALTLTSYRAQDLGRALSRHA